MITRRSFIRNAVAVITTLAAGKEVIAKVKPQKLYPIIPQPCHDPLGEDIISRCLRYPNTDRMVVNIGYNSDLRKYKKDLWKKHSGTIVTGGKSPCFDTERHSIFKFPNGSTLHIVNIYELDEVYKLMGMEFQEIKRISIGRSVNNSISTDDLISINRHLDMIIRRKMIATGPNSVKFI